MPARDNGFDKSKENINRKGRPPKEHCLTDLLKEALDQPHTKSGKTNKQMIIDKMFELANKGDANILKYLFDRIDGKPLQTIEANVKRDDIDLSKLSKEELKIVADLNRKRKSQGDDMIIEGTVFEKKVYINTDKIVKK